MKKTLLPILLIFLLSISPLVSAIGEQKLVWMMGDTQFDVPSPTYQKDAEYFYTAVYDTNDNITDVSIAMVVGDCVDHTYASSWSKFHEIFEVINVNYYKNYTIGNHELYGDGDWWNYAYGGYDHLCYNFTYGNIMFICIGDNESGFGDGDYTNCGQIDYLNTTVQNNQDKNIIVLCHHPLENTTNCTDGGWDEMTHAKGGDEAKWILNNYNVALWIHGHTHLPLNMTKTRVFRYGTLHVSVGGLLLNLDGTLLATGVNITIDSTFLYLTKGSKTVGVRGRNANTSEFMYQHYEWADNGTWLNGTWLDYPFILGTPATISNPTIANESATSAAQHYFNVTVNDVDGDTMNWTIQLSNDEEASGGPVENGTISCVMNLSSGDTVTAWVNITDDGITMSRASYWFTTEVGDQWLDVTILKSTFDAGLMGTAVFSIIGVAIVVGAIMAIVGLVFRAVNRRRDEYDSY